MTTVTLSKCHSAPMYELPKPPDGIFCPTGKYFSICTRCFKPSKAVRYPFENRDEMLAFLETRKMYGSAWTSDPKRTAEWHDLRNVTRASYVAAIITAVIFIGILVAFAAR